MALRKGGGNPATGEVRTDRNQQRGGWMIVRGAQAAGLGADIVLSVSKTVVLRAFVFVHQSESSNGFS